MLQSTISTEDVSMKNYAMLELNYSNSGINFVTTDEKARKWVIDLIKTKIPRATAEATSEGTHVSKLDSRDIEIAEWLKGQLCLNGWEPFAVNVVPRTNNYINTTTIYYFRIEITPS